MPPIEECDLWQHAVYWPFAKVNRYGQQVVGDPQQLDVRWHDTKTQKMDPKRRVTGVEVQVITSQYLAMGSILWLGSLDDIPAGTVPNMGLYEVVKDMTTPDLKDRFQRREYGLNRFSKAFPSS